MSQKLVILDYLKTGKGITPLQALNLCGSLRLSERIRDLEADGYSIRHVPYLTGKKRVMSYFLNTPTPAEKYFAKIKSMDPRCR